LVLCEKDLATMYFIPSLSLFLRSGMFAILVRTFVSVGGCI
jgi:hypothetical protein